MGILTHYFAAEDDAAAAACVSHPDEHAPHDDPAGHLHDAVRSVGLDPFVTLGTLASVLTGRSYHDVTRHPRHGGVVAAAGDEGPWVVTVSDELVGALAASTRAGLGRVLGRWRTPGDPSGSEPAAVLALLDDLAELCTRARESGHRVYCWACLPSR